ncbi:ATP-binding protein [Emticicia sp. SJ17W-69]|uniref:ATP-binding protein n=1 Tax=Emticicia sp. SJ17W-69 TaxID=3421657 RepID=UPI003EBCC21E
MDDLDFSEVVPNIAITFVVMRFLMTYLETEKRLPHLHKILNFAWLWALILLAMSSVLGLKFINENYILLLSLVILYILDKSREMPITRMLAIAIIPYTVVSLINAIFELLTPKFHESNISIFASFKGFAITWLIGFSIYSQRQGKRERQQRLKDEEEKKKLEAKKQELEYQVAERTAELTRQKEELEQTVIELKTTQNQLVHAEKMASLGELTAGIAHEIQNPLNFVNNFSEVSVELCQEITEELEKENFDKTYIIEILSDLSQNQEKITHHGQRAASIVKGMLQHSRTSTGQKELTDINVLADEYIRLSYHGLRAKDKSFMADFKTNLDPNLPKIKIIPQDFGRVLLNVINNAFYAVQQKAKLKLDGYKPLVSIDTYLEDGEVVVKIKDNGTGMPESVKSKIFQPFFTTKPTGQGTGLGLSLAYDIITKGHGGTMEVDSVEGEWTVFIIKLPID